jgi:hypothetical protein
MQVKIDIIAGSTWLPDEASGTAKTKTGGICRLSS